MDIFSWVRDCDFPFLRGVPELVMIPLEADDVPAVLSKHRHEFVGVIAFSNDFHCFSPNFDAPMATRLYTRTSPLGKSFAKVGILGLQKASCGVVHGDL